MIKIVDSLCDNTDSLDELYKFFHYAGSWQYDFMPRNYVSKRKQNTKEETTICNVIKKICEVEPKFIGKGYEVWVNVLDNTNKHLDHHVDCDEEQEGIHPAKMTATVYLGSDIDGGELAVDTNEFSEESTSFHEDIYDLKEDMDNNWLKIPYKYNRAVLFDSNYPHAVLPITRIDQGASRISLVISSWDKKIKVIR